MDDFKYSVEETSTFSHFAEDYPFAVYRRNEYIDQMVYVSTTEADAQEVADIIAADDETARQWDEAINIKRQVAAQPLLPADAENLKKDPEHFLTNWRGLKDMELRQIGISDNLQDQAQLWAIQGYDEAKQHLVPLLKDVERDADMLQYIPHTLIPDTDLAMTYCIYGRDTAGEEIAQVNVTGVLLHEWGVTIEDVARDAMICAPEIKPARVTSLNQVIANLSGQDISEANDNQIIQNYVIETADHINGASAVFYPGMMDKVADRIGGDFYLTPSSRHEMIASAGAGIDEKYLTQQLQEINDDPYSMKPDDVFGYTTYHYDAEAKRFELAKDFEARKEKEKQTPAHEEIPTQEVYPREEKPAQTQETAPEDNTPRKQLEKQLTEGVKRILNGDEFKAFLTASALTPLNKYSFKNAILIYIQRPDATHTAGYEDWKNYGRAVAQGSTAIKIFKPVIAYEKNRGALAQTIIANLNKQLSADPSKMAVYALGQSGMEFTRASQNGNIGIKFKGNERGLYTEENLKKFLSKSVVGKLPVGYSVANVFDVSDTIVPEHLWMKSGFTKDEIAKDENGNPIKNRRGETKIINTPERQAKFKSEMDLTMRKMDPEKSAALYSALTYISERNGVPVSEKSSSEDKELTGGVDGYYCRENTEETPKGYIVVNKYMSADRKCAVLIHEITHSELHREPEKTAELMGEKKLTTTLKEIQAEAVAYTVGKRYGLDMDTPSFKYLAAYTQGNELLDMQKSMDIIYNEAKKLGNEIEAVLQEFEQAKDLEEVQEQSSQEPVKEEAQAEEPSKLETGPMSMSDWKAKIAEERAARETETQGGDDRTKTTNKDRDDR